MKALQRFATMLGIGEHQAEDALHSERAARAVLSRRNLFAAGAAMAAGSAFSFAKPEPLGMWITNDPKFLAAWNHPDVIFLARKMLEHFEFMSQAMRDRRLLEMA